MELPTARSPLSVRHVRAGPLQALLGHPGLLVSLGVAFLVILPLIQHVHIAEYDEAVLLDVARNIQRTGLPLRSIGAYGVPLLDHTPLYPFLLSLYAPTTGDTLVAARGITAAVGLLCIALTYMIGARIGGKAVAFLAALFVALNPFLAVYSYFVRMEMFMVAAILLAIYLLVRCQPLSIAGILVAGCALAAGCLFKEFAIVFLIPAVLYVWLTQRGSVGRRAIATLALVGPTIVAMVGWAVWVVSFWPAAFGPAMQRWLHAAAGGKVGDPRMLVGWGAWTGQLVEDLFRPGLILALSVALLAKLVSRRPRLTAAEALLWGYFVTAVGLSYLISLREPRHLIAVVPVAAILGAQGLVSLFRVLRPASMLVKVGAGLLAVILLTFAGPWRPAAALAGRLSGTVLTPTYRARLEDNDRIYGPMARTGVELGKISASGEVVVVAHYGPVIAYYADRRYLMLYTLTEPVIMQALDQARLLVWDTPTWLVLPADRVPIVEERVAAEFELRQREGEAPPEIKIYQRKQ